MFYYSPSDARIVMPHQPYKESLSALKEQIHTADAILIGAGSGLSTAAGYIYTGDRFERYFSDFIQKYGIRDMYTGGFYPYATGNEFWGFWCRYIWINRYAPVPSSLYQDLLDLVRDKDYFVLTTNVDHCLQRAGYDKKKLFYTQGDYGLFQSSRPHGTSAHKTYDNEEVIRKMVLNEGFEIDENNNLIIPENAEIRMTVNSDLIPICPDDNEPMTTNLRSDDTFVEDRGWHDAADRYYQFMNRHQNMHVLYLEMGVGMNTPVIIKYPFWQYTEKNANAFYACLNYGEAMCPESIASRSICINKDIAEVVHDLRE